MKIINYYRNILLINNKNIISYKFFINYSPIIIYIQIIN